MCVVGDSFVEGTGSSFGGVSPYGLLGVPNYLGMYLGVDNTRCSGSGGTGWNHVSGGRCNILDRNQLDVVATHPDVVVYAAGTNDADNPAQAAANCASALTQTRASLPAAMIYVIGPWDGQAPAAMDAGLAAVRDALKSAAAGRGGVKFLDTTGVAFTKCGDMTHPDLVGHQTLALWVNKQVRTDLGVIDQIYDDFSWHADGTPTYLITGQPWVQVPLHDGGGDLTTVVASISGGMLVASDSGQDRTASYTGVDCGTPPQSMYATVSFTAGAAGGGVCLLTNKIGLDRNEYIGQGGALHIVYGPWSTTVGYFDVVHGFVIIDVPQYYPIETGKVVQLGWRISGDTTYVLTPDGVERTYTDPNMISNNGRYAMFETYWGAGQSQGQFHTVSVNKPLSAPAASSLMSIGRSYDIDAVTAQSITVPRGGVPSGSLIVVIVDAGQSNIPINGAVSDPHNASYIAIDGQYNWGNQTYGYGRIYYCYNSAALSSGDLITLTLPQAAAHLKMSAFYWTDAETASDPRDYAVTATTTGISSANPLFSLTSGIPSKAGDLMLGVVTTSPNSGGAAGNWYGQDTAHGWSGPPPLESGYLPPYSCFAEIDGGTQINAGTGAVTFSPGNPAEQSNLTYAAWVVGFKAK